MPDGDSVIACAAAPPARQLSGSRLWRDWKFLTLAAGMELGLFAQIGLTAHLFSLLTPTVGAQQAGLMMGLATAWASSLAQSSGG